MPYSRNGTSLRLASNPVPVLFDNRSANRSVGGGSGVSFGDARSGAGNRPATKTWDVVDCRQHVEAGGLSAAGVSPQKSQPDWVDAHMAEPGAKRGLKTSYAPGSVAIGPNGITHAGEEERGPTLMESLYKREAAAQLDRRKGRRTSPSIISSELPPIGMPTTPMSNGTARRPLFPAHTVQSATRRRESSSEFRPGSGQRVVHSNGIHNKLYRQALKKQSVGGDTALPHTVAEPNFTRGLRGLTPQRSRKTPWGSGTKQEAWEWRNPAKLVPAQSVKNTNVHVASRDEKIWERLTKEGDIIHRRHEASRAAAKERPPQDPAKKQRSYQKCYDLVGSTFGSKDARTEKQQKTSVQASASPVRARAEERLKNNSKEAAWQRLYAENTKRINKRTLAITEQKPAPKFQHKPIRKAGIKPTDTGYNNSLYITRKGWLRADSKDRRPSQDLVQDDPLGGLGVGGDPKGIPRVTSINVPSSSNKKPGAGFGGGAKKARSAQPAEARAARQHFAPTASAYAGVEEPFQTMPMEVLDEEDHIVRHLPNDDVVSMSHHEVTVLRSTGELMSMSRQVSEEVIIVHPEMPLGTDVEMHLLDSTNIHASARKHYASQDGEEEEEAGELCRQKLNQERDGRQDGDDEEDTAFRATMRVGEKSGEQSQQEEEQEQEEEFGELGPQEQNPEWEDGRRDREDGEEEAAFRATLRVAEKSGEPTALNNHSTAPGVRGVSGKTKEEIESERFYRAEIERLAREEEDRERAERDRRAVAVRERVEFIEKMQQEQQQEKQQQQQQEKQKQKQGGYSGSADAQPQPRGAQAAPQAAAPSASAAAAAAAAAAVQRQTSSTRYQPPAPQKMQPLGSKMSPMQRAAALRRQAPVNPHADDSNSEEDIAG